MSRLDPSLIVPGQWDQIGLLLNNGFLAVALFITACAAFLLAHAMIPSLVASGDAPVGAARLRLPFYLLFGIALALSLYALARMLQAAVAFELEFYPRFGY